eukprot:scaffold20013_cov31-Tisochrysis_lutea.AAC.1
MIGYHGVPCGTASRVLPSKFGWCGTTSWVLAPPLVVGFALGNVIVTPMPLQWSSLVSLAARTRREAARGRGGLCRTWDEDGIVGRERVRRAGG